MDLMDSILFFRLACRILGPRRNMKATMPGERKIPKRRYCGKRKFVAKRVRMKIKAVDGSMIFSMLRCSSRLAC